MRRLLILLVGGAAVSSACQSGVDAPSPSSNVTSAASATSTPVLAPSAQAVLDTLDTRTPVPLLPMMANHQKQNMREHLVAVQEIVAGIGANDFTAIEKASKRIGYSEQMGQMCTHMGAGAPGFSEQALAFHRTADKIGEAARSRDMKGVLATLDETMAACTSCHAMFKQHVVDDATWVSTIPNVPASDGTHAPFP